MPEQTKNEEFKSMIANSGKMPTAKDIFPDEATVTMIFPHPVRLMLDGDNHRHIQIQFQQGAQEVPVSLKDHWYLRDNGVTAYRAADEGTKKPEVKAEPVVITQHHVDFLASRGYQFPSIDKAQEFVDRMTDDERAGFLVEATEWTPGEKEEDEEPVDLSAMKKDELIAHAAEVHGLELDPKAKKEDMIAAIEEAQQKS